MRMRLKAWICVGWENNNIESKISVFSTHPLVNLYYVYSVLVSFLHNKVSRMRWVSIKENELGYHNLYSFSGHN